MREAHLHRPHCCNKNPILPNWLLKPKKWFTAISVSHSSNRWQSHTHAGMLEKWASSSISLVWAHPTHFLKWVSPRSLICRIFSGTTEAAIDTLLYISSKLFIQSVTVLQKNVLFCTNCLDPLTKVSCRSCMVDYWLLQHSLNLFYNRKVAFELLMTVFLFFFVLRMVWLKDVGEELNQRLTAAKLSLSEQGNPTKPPGLTMLSL